MSLRRDRGSIGYAAAVSPASATPDRRRVDAAPARARELRHLLLRLLGDYWLSPSATIPSTALVDLMADFGVSSHGSRAALARLSKRGLLTSVRRGRRTYYGLTERAVAVLQDGARRFARFGAGDVEWDGRWRVVAFSVPESIRPVRYVLRERLRWLGFAPLYDGLWVSPWGSLDQVISTLRELNLETATAMYATPVESPEIGRHPVQAWDLVAAEEAYRQFLATWSPWRDSVQAGDVGVAEALRLRTEITGSWREFPNVEPDLPAELLPPHWLRADARQLFIDVYDGLGPIAELRVRQVVSSYTDDEDAKPRHHAVAYLASLT